MSYDEVEFEPEDWSGEDRASLLKAAQDLAAADPDPSKIGLAMDMILQELEAFDDPRQGIGSWLKEEELPDLEELAQRLSQIVGSERPIEAGARAIAHRNWSGVRAVAGRLLAPRGAPRS